MTYMLRVVGVVSLLIASVSGWALYIRGRHKAGNLSLLMALLGLSGMALTPYRDAPHAERRAPVAERRTPSAVAITPVADYRDLPEWARFVASTRTDSSTYHAAGHCSKYGSTLKVVFAYRSEEEARSHDKRPCPHCIVQALADSR